MIRIGDMGGGGEMITIFYTEHTLGETKTLID